MSSTLVWNKCSFFSSLEGINHTELMNNYRGAWSTLFVLFSSVVCLACHPAIKKQNTKKKLYSMIHMTSAKGAHQQPSLIVLECGIMDLEFSSHHV